MEAKTNAMRILDKLKVSYKHYQYDADKAVSGAEVAAILGENPAQVFKTLVTVAKSKKYYVFMLPVLSELDLKKAAAAVKEKSVEMLKQKFLLELTGYVHGGCSPIGMKKFFTTRLDSSALNCQTIIFSGGRIGLQLEMSPGDLAKAVKYETAELTVDDKDTEQSI